jgi:GH15 family glucan-1,4-alpha-glucosidase
MSRPLEDYALIGDGETAALVARNGSIDWLCWPRFDSDACFAALLGTEAHGRWRIWPQGTILQITRRYRRDTLIVETDFETESGRIRLIDFMPPRRAVSSVVRILTGLDGRVALRSELRLRFDYGSLPPWCEKTPDGAIFRVGPDIVVLRSPVPHRLDDECQSAAFTVNAGERVAFVLSHSLQHPPPIPEDAEEALTATQSYWRDWIARFDDAKTEWPEAVRRSLITLRAMILSQAGAWSRLQPPRCRKRRAVR